MKFLVSEVSVRRSRGRRGNPLGLASSGTDTKSRTWRIDPVRDRGDESSHKTDDTVDSKLHLAIDGSLDVVHRTVYLLCEGGIRGGRNKYTRDREI